MAGSDPKFPAVSLGPFDPSAPASVQEARIESAVRLAIWPHLIMALTDWLGILVLGFLINAGKLSADPFGYGIILLASGSAFAKFKSFKGGSTTAILVAAGPGAWKAVGLLVGKGTVG